MDIFSSFSASRPCVLLDAPVLPAFLSEPLTEEKML